jgi:hypothetical protein
MGDRYLAETGFNSQMTPEPVEPGMPDNLFAPVPGNYEARGRFGSNGRKVNDRAWVSSLPLAAFAAGAIGLGVAGYLEPD